MKIRKNLFKLPGGKYLVKVKAGGQRFRRRFGDRREAESFLARVLDRRAADRFEDEGFQYPKETADLEAVANAPKSLGELMERFQKEYTKKNGLPKRSKKRMRDPSLISRPISRSGPRCPCLLSQGPGLRAIWSTGRPRFLPLRSITKSPISRKS